MKRNLVMLCLLGTAVFMSSCQHIDSSSDDDLVQEDGSVKKSKDVQFYMKGVPLEYSSKATLANAYCTDLWIWEGTTLLAHKQSTESDFDMPTVNLTYGTHTLTFVASASNSQSWVSGVWSTTKVIDDFCTTMDVTVTASSGNSRQVQLTRRSSRVKFVTTDKIPTNVTKCHIKAASHNQLDASLAGLNAFTYEATVDISSKQGSTYSVFVNTLTASPTEEEDCAVTVEFLDASGSVLYTYDRTLTMKANRCITLTGAFFSGASNAISIASTDFDEVTQQLYE